MTDGDYRIGQPCNGPPTVTMLKPRPSGLKTVCFSKACPIFVGDVRFGAVFGFQPQSASDCSLRLRPGPEEHGSENIEHGEQLRDMFENPLIRFWLVWD